MPKYYNNLPDSPLYDPRTRVLKYRHEEDFETLRLNLLGTGQVYTDTKFAYYIDKNTEWRRPKEVCRNPKFINEKPKRFDALQGYMGDCWLISGIEVLTLHDKLHHYVVPRDQDFGENYIGAFHFRIWQLGFWYDVVVDDRLPVFKNTKKLVYAHSKSGDVFWAALLEKTYAKICGVYNDITFGMLSIGRGMTALQDLTGGMTEIILLRYITPTRLVWVLNEVYTNKAFMLGVCCKDKGEKGLFYAHTYAISKIFKSPDDDPDYHGLFLIRLMNPWGQVEWKGKWGDEDYNYWRQIDREILDHLQFKKEDDGEFWMNADDLTKYFAYIYICHLGPGQYLRRIKGITYNKWRSTVFSGEWVKGENAAGYTLVNRHKNPQYRIHLDWPQSDIDRDGNCTVVIELIQRSKLGRQPKIKMAFYIYHLSEVEDIPEPLTRDYIETHDPINKYPEFNSGFGRNYLKQMDLFCPGRYCIIPCTKDKDMESQFLLRVFSESRVAIWEYDTHISRSLSMEEKSTQNFDERLKALFDDVAQGQDEIDCLGLKEILEAEMNPRKTFYQMISSIGKFFENMFSRRSSNDYEDSDSVFSKDECRSMIAMVDDNHSGKIGFSEFITLWKNICFWTKVYENHKDETEGYVTVAQLRDALGSIGYVVNKRTVHSLIYLYANENGNIQLTDFILCGVSLETVLDIRDKKYTAGEYNITFTMEEWVKNILIM